jgi:ribonuclease HI
MCYCNGPEEGENQIGRTDVNFQCGEDKRIIMTDFLSNIVAQKETFTRRNSRKMILKDLMAEEGSNLNLMWVPAHVSIKGNETADKAAKEALNQEVDDTYKMVKSDWSKWVKRKS